MVVSWATGEANAVGGNTPTQHAQSPFGPLSTVQEVPDSDEEFPVVFGERADSMREQGIGNMTSYTQVYTGEQHCPGRSLGPVCLLISVPRKVNPTCDARAKVPQLWCRLQE